MGAIVAGACSRQASGRRRKLAANEILQFCQGLIQYSQAQTAFCGHNPGSDMFLCLTVCRRHCRRTPHPFLHLRAYVGSIFRSHHIVTPIVFSDISSSERFSQKRSLLGIIQCPIVIKVFDVNRAGVNLLSIFFFGIYPGCDKFCSISIPYFKIAPIPFKN